MPGWLKRLAGFALVPLSLLPLVAIVPVMAPSVAQRIDVLEGVGLTAPPADAAEPASLDVLLVAPLVPEGSR